jgi:hypothetical protein
MVVLRIALQLAPGGLLGVGLAHLDVDNRAAVLAAVTEVVAGEFIPPAPTAVR